MNLDKIYEQQLRECKQVADNLTPVLICLNSFYKNCVQLLTPEEIIELSVAEFFIDRIRTRYQQKK